MRPVERMTRRNEVGITLKRLTDAPTPAATEIGILVPSNQRQHRTLHMRKDVLPYAS